MCPEAVNCIGYVYHQVGLEEREVFIDPPELDHLLGDFSIVEPDAAVAVGVLDIFDDGRSLKSSITKRVIHMAVIDREEPGLIYHRRGFNRPPESDLLDAGLERYLLDPSYSPGNGCAVSTEILYLALKEKKI